MCYDFPADFSMKRLVAIVLFAGAVLLSTHILAPAAASRPLPPIKPAELAAVAQTQAAVDEVNAQVDRLHDRLAPPLEYPAPTHDPFHYGARAEPAPSKPPAPAPRPAAIAVPTTPVPVLPRLVAIITNATDAGLSRAAVLAVGDDVQVVKPGEPISRFVVRGVGPDQIELADPQSGATFKISLQ